MSCSDLFSQVNIAKSALSEQAIENGYCLDPDIAGITYVETYGTYEYVSMYFLSCWEDEEIEDKENTCMSNREI